MNLDEQGRKRLRSGGAMLLLLAFLLLLIPVLALSRYARGSADDYCFGIYTYHALQNGESLLAAVWRTVSGYYQSWQGSFAAVGMMSLTPCIWGETAYGITAVVMLASLIAGTVKLTDTLVRRLAGGDWRDVIYIAVPMLICATQFMPSPLNSVYWWNGSVYYTFFYGLSLFYAERFAALLFLPRSNRAAILVPGLLCGVLVGGSNYVSALLSALLGGLFWLYAMWKKRARWSAFLLLCGEAIPFFVSMAAPGNRIRQDTIASTPPVQAIWEAIGQAAADLTEWPNWPILLMLLAWLPLLWRLCGKSGFSFPLPGLFAAAVFLLFAAQNTPHFYAASNAGPLRLRDIVYFSSYWLYLLCEWYCVGWLRRFLRQIPAFPKPRPWMGRTAAAALVLLAGFCLFSYGPTGFTAGCLRELNSGVAADYAGERDARLADLTDPAVSGPVFPAIRSRPILLYQQDITTDPSDWKNHVMAMYWEKDSVSIAVANGGK